MGKNNIIHINVHRKEETGTRMFTYLPRDTAIAEMRGPYTPLVGIIVVPLPAQ